METTEELKKKIEEGIKNGDYDFRELREVEGRGLCALQRFIFTTGLVYGIDDMMVEGRYCYENYYDAKEALYNWTGEGDPQDEDWIKHKGRSGEWSNDKKEE